MLGLTSSASARGGGIRAPMGRIYHPREDLDYDDLGRGLAQGSRPATGTMVANAGFDTLVLCAKEYQPPAAAFPGVRHVLRLPIDDTVEPMDRYDVARTFKVATTVAERLRRGRKVLVTCHAGLNRSGLVCALALRMIHGAPAEDVIMHVRARRSARALSNPTFESLVRRLRKKQAA